MTQEIHFPGPDGAAAPVLVLTTWPADRDPDVLVRPLVGESLVACANVLPAMDSFYRWRGELHRDREHQVLMKTTRGRLDALHAKLRALHPYEVPEFLVVPVCAGAGDYLAWVAASGDAGP